MKLLYTIAAALLTVSVSASPVMKKADLSNPPAALTAASVAKKVEVSKTPQGAKAQRVFDMEKVSQKVDAANARFASKNNQLMKVASAAKAPKKAQTTEGNVTVTTDENGVITDVTGGVAKTYDRVDGFTWYISNKQLSGAYQTGKVEVVEDGDNVYIKDILTRYTVGTWVKGTISGNTLSVPVGQPLAFSSNYNTTLSLQWCNLETLDKEFNHGDITFTIDGNTLTLEGTASPHEAEEGFMIGLYWDDDDTYQGYWDACTVLHYDENYVAPELVELPAGADVETWYLTGEQLSNNGSTPVKNRPVEVAFVGSDVYLVGVSEDFPSAWIKGTVDAEGLITFAGEQFVGTYAGLDIFFFGTDGEGLTDAVAFLDADAKVITVNCGLLFNAATDRIYYLEWLDSVVIAAEAAASPDLVTLPEGVEPETWYMNGESTDGQYYDPITNREVQIAFVGNEVYIAGMSEYLSEAWVKGTMDEEGLITFPGGQYVGEFMEYDIFFYGTHGDDLCDVVAFYDEETKSITVNTGVLFNASTTEIYFLEWFDSLLITAEPAEEPEMVELPAGAEVEDWYMNGTIIDEEDVAPVVNRKVQVAFVDNEVYVAGLSEMMPTAWIKGTIDGTTITFPYNQYLGSFYGFYDIWITGVAIEGDEPTMCDMTATYDADTKTISFNEMFMVNTSKTDFFYAEWYAMVELTAEAAYVEEPILTEDVAELPYFNGFDTEDEVAQAFIFDANYDGKTFSISGGEASYTYSSTQAADDYIVFPGLELKEGHSYTVKVDVADYMAAYPERVEVVCGKVAKASELTISVIAPYDILTEEFETISNTEFTVEDSGVYFFAVHAISDPDTYKLFVDNFTVEENMIEVRWENSSKQFTAPHVHYTLDGGFTWEDPVAMTEWSEVETYSDEAASTEGLDLQIWTAMVPATATHVCFSDLGIEETATDGFEAVHQALYTEAGMTGVENVAVDAAEAAAIYFNLQGSRVMRPAAGQVVIMVKNGVATKVRF